VRKNAIGDEGVKRIAIALETNVSILNLSLYSNSIGTAGAEHLAFMIRKNNNLQKLSLFSNGLGDHAAALLAAAVPGNRGALRKLSVYSSTLSDDGAAKLRDAFDHQARLVKLSLSPSAAGMRRTCQRTPGSGMPASPPALMRAGEDSATGVGVEDDKKMMLSLQYGVGPLNELAPIDQQRQAKARQEEEAKAKEEREKAEKARTLTAHIPTVPNLSSVNIPAPRLGFQKTATIAPEPTVTEPKTSSLGSSSSEPSLKNESAQRSPAEGKQMHKSSSCLVQ